MADLRTRFQEKVSASLAFFVVALVAYAFTLLMFKDIPQPSRDIIMVLIGVIATNATQAVQHWFGSTPGSQRKDDTISVLAQTAKTAGEALTTTATQAPDTLKPGEVATVTATAAGTKIERVADVPNGFPEWKIQQEAGGRMFTDTAEALAAYKREILGE